jgi:hypothetical protein
VCGREGLCKSPGVGEKRGRKNGKCWTTNLPRYGILIDRRRDKRRSKAAALDLEANRGVSTRLKREEVDEGSAHVESHFCRPKRVVEQMQPPATAPPRSKPAKFLSAGVASQPMSARPYTAEPSTSFRLTESSGLLSGTLGHDIH